SLIDGFDDRIPDIRATLGDLTNSIPGSVGTPASGRGAPTIYVRIGNEAVDQYVTAIVDRKDDDDSRAMAQGVRRYWQNCLARTLPSGSAGAARCRSPSTSSGASG